MPTHNSQSSNFQSSYRPEPSRSEVDSLDGKVVIEFGAPWCPICQGAQQDIAEAIRAHPDIKHLKVEDGSGRPLGRSFRIKLWPSLVVLQDGTEVARVVRPPDVATINDALAKLN